MKKRGPKWRCVKTVVNVNLELTARDAVKAVRRRNLIVVIDVLRCSSSIINVLAKGAKEVIPVRTLKEAYELRRERPDYLLAGERRGLKPRGFDFGNSPLEFTREKVYGKTLIFTTTSGTAALTRSRTTESVLIGAFLNAGSVATAALELAKKGEIGISLVLSGRRGHFSLEDFLCAGALAEGFREEETGLSDASFAAFLAFKHVKNNLCEYIMMGEHAKHLIELGFRRDIAFSCQYDLLKVVPTYKDGIVKILK